MQTNLQLEDRRLTPEFLKDPYHFDDRRLIGEAMQLLLVRYRSEYPRPFETYYQFIDVFCREKVEER